MDVHSVSAKEALEALGSAEAGISSQEAAKRLEEHGPNVIDSGKKISVLALLIEQFTDPLVLILIAASLVSLFFGKTIDATLIIAIVAANGIFGFVQNYNAEKSIEALKRMGSPHALVFRDGSLKEIPSGQIVPGDIIYLHEGCKVPADCRLIESSELGVDESILTGESLPVGKTTAPIAKSALLAERTNMVFMDTAVVRGKGKALVAATGNKTEVGKIAKNLASIEEEPTRFQRELEALGGKIGKGILVLVLLIALTMFALHEASLLDIFITSVSVAVAAIPEGLPAVVTLSLAIATRKMLKKNSLVRKLPVVENLGSIEVICTDKTGTLTENSMTVQRLYFDGKIFDVTGTGRATGGDFLLDGEKTPAKKIGPLLLCGLACNDTIIEKPADGKSPIGFRGDPTEIALVISALKGEVSLDGFERVKDFPFTSNRKRMTVVMESNGKKNAYAKGAPEFIIESCAHILKGGKKIPFSPKEKKLAFEQTEKMASGAMRVLAFAQKEIGKGKNAMEKAEGGMVFLGLQGMIDPPRQEVREALNTCRQAGIRVVMLTGDNKSTAAAIAAKVGFAGSAIDAKELSALSAEEFEKAVFTHDVFSRVSPEQKLEVLRVLKKAGLSVAMTGDGINDAPALKQADVGIAMGIRGSDVAKETSDIVLLDDNFATIVEAIREGRGVFENIRKFVLYLLASNVAEVFVVFIASIAGSLPITAVQLLFVNLLTDGLPALALGADPPRPGIMLEKPRKGGDGVIDGQTASLLLLMGLTSTIIILALFFSYLPQGLAIAQTVVFTSFIIFEFAKLVVIRQKDGLGMASNKWLLAALAGSVVIQLAIMYSPAAGLFGVVSLGGAEWGMIILGGIVAYAVNTIGTKIILRKVPTGTGF